MEKETYTNDNGNTGTVDVPVFVFNLDIYNEKISEKKNVPDEARIEVHQNPNEIVFV
jgi:hypothetical protein